jgi:hypothetical protein
MGVRQELSGDENGTGLICGLLCGASGKADRTPCHPARIAPFLTLQQNGRGRQASEHPSDSCLRSRQHCGQSDTHWMLEPLNMFSTHLVAHNMANTRETGIGVHGEGGGAEGQRTEQVRKQERESARERHTQSERAKERDSAQGSKGVK